MQPEYAYNGRGEGCPLCDTESFNPGFIDRRLNNAHWSADPQESQQRLCQSPEPDYSAMKRELERRYGIMASTTQIERHWKRHLSFRTEQRRCWQNGG